MSNFTVKQVKAVLSANGLPTENLDAAANELCSRHKTSLDAIIEERDGFKEKAKQYDDVKKELDGLKANPTDDWKEKYEKEHSDFEAYKNGVIAKETKATKEKAVREFLKSTVNIADNRLDAVMKVTNLDDYELDESGKIKDSDKKAESAKKEWADFVVVKKKDGANPPQPQNNEPNNPPKMSRAAQLTKQYQKNLYGEAKEN